MTTTQPIASLFANDIHRRQLGTGRVGEVPQLRRLIL